MRLPIEGIRLHLPFATPSQNVYMRWHYRQRGRFRDEVRLILRAQLRALMPSPGPLEPETRRMVVEFLRRSTRQLDYGNCVGGMKACLDSLCLEGLLKDDSPRWVQEVYHQEKCRAGSESTSIWVYPAVEPAPKD